MDTTEKKILKIWFFLLIPAILLMVFLWMTGETSKNFTLNVFLVVLKFLGGFGIAAGVSGLVIFILTKYEHKFQGEDNKKKLQRVLFTVLMIFIVLLFYQGPWKIIQSIFIPGNNDNLFDKLLFIYGIWSLMINLYIKPLIKGEFYSVTTISTGEMIKKGIQGGVRGIKKKFFTWKQNYAKSSLQDQISLNEYIKVWRQRLAVIVLPFLGIGSIVFTPLAVIFIFMAIRIFYYNPRDPMKFEDWFLILASFSVCIIGLLLPFYTELMEFYINIRSYYYIVYIFQFMGMFLASYIYLSKILKPIKQERQKQQVKDLKEEKKVLEKQKLELENEKRQLQKEIEKQNQ